MQALTIYSVQFTHNFSLLVKVEMCLISSECTRLNGIYEVSMS